MISTKYEQFWNEQRGAAALGLAEGKSQQQVASLVGVTDRTIRNWLDDNRFLAEIDRLSLMVGVASRAERLRLVNRLVKQKVREEDGYIITEKDLLDWLKFAQSETDGAKLDFSKLAELLTGQEQQSDGPGGLTTSQSQSPALLASADSVIEVEANSGPLSSSSSSSSSQPDDLDFNPS